MKRAVLSALALMFAVHVPTTKVQPASKNGMYTVVKEVPGRKPRWTVGYIWPLELASITRRSLTNGRTEQALAKQPQKSLSTRKTSSKLEAPLNE
jgi:hypothetical protein